MDGLSAFQREFQYNRRLCITYEGFFTGDMPPIANRQI
jgi:hypothetical protein